LPTLSWTLALTSATTYLKYKFYSDIILKQLKNTSFINIRLMPKI